MSFCTVKHARNTTSLLCLNNRRELESCLKLPFWNVISGIRCLILKLILIWYCRTRIPVLQRHKIYIYSVEWRKNKISHVLNNKCQYHNLHNALFFFSDVAMLQNVYFYIQKYPPHCCRYIWSHGKYCVRPFRRHSFHIRSEEKNKNKKHPFEMKPIWSETRNRTSDGFTNLILTGGLTGDTSYPSLSPLADQYQESGHYAPLKALHEQSICYYFSSAGCI